MTQVTGLKDASKLPSYPDYDMKQPKIVSEYDQEIPQSQTADNPLAPRGRAAQPPRDTRKTIFSNNLLSAFRIASFPGTFLFLNFLRELKVLSYS